MTYKEKFDSLPEEPKNNDLEEEIRKYNEDLNLDIEMDYSWDDIEANVVLAARHFAEWQRKLMMKKAIVAPLYLDGDFLTIDRDFSKMGYKVGDKVKVIIVKED